MRALAWYSVVFVMSSWSGAAQSAAPTPLSESLRALNRSQLAEVSDYECDVELESVVRVEYAEPIRRLAQSRYSKMGRRSHVWYLQLSGEEHLPWPGSLTEIDWTKVDQAVEAAVTPEHKLVYQRVEDPSDSIVTEVRPPDADDLQLGLLNLHNILRGVLPGSTRSLADFIVECRSIDVRPSRSPKRVTATGTLREGDFEIEIDVHHGGALSFARVHRRWDQLLYGEPLWLHQRKVKARASGGALTPTDADRRVEQSVELFIERHITVGLSSVPAKAVLKQRSVAADGQITIVESTITLASLRVEEPIPDHLLMHIPDGTRAFTRGVEDGVPRVWRDMKIVNSDESAFAAQLDDVVEALEPVTPATSTRAVFAWAATAFVTAVLAGCITWRASRRTSA